MRVSFLSAAVLAAGLSTVMSGCGNDGQPAPTGTPSTTTSSSVAPAPSAVAGVSPGGVTPRVDVPAAATESQFGQACHAAVEWMGIQHADPATLVEPYLATLQQPDAAGPGTFDLRWSALTPAQQAGVIMAAEQAARGECGCPAQLVRKSLIRSF